jgi:DNA-binding TFAR19-related protein (PDSD5 family)
MSDEIVEDTLPAEEVTEDPEIPAEEIPETPAEDLEQLRKDAKAFKDQKARAEKAEGELKKLKQAPPSNDLSPATQQRLDRIELTSLGHKDREEQDFILNAAKRLGISVGEAADDEFVKSKLDRMQATRKSKEATPDPSRRGGSARNTKLPDFSKMSNTEFDKWERDNR